MFPCTLKDLRKKGVDKANHRAYTRKCIPTHSKLYQF
jgi:hypothetical protein